MIKRKFGMAVLNISQSRCDMRIKNVYIKE